MTYGQTISDDFRRAVFECPEPVACCVTACRVTRRWLTHSAAREAFTTKDTKNTKVEEAEKKTGRQPQVPQPDEERNPRDAELSEQESEFRVIRSNPR